MAITVSQWSHKLWIPDQYIPGSSETGIPLVINDAVIAKMSATDQSIFWANVQNGGGDLRACGNEDGTGQYPLEVVSCDTVAETVVMHVRRPYTGADGVWVFLGKAGETQPLVTDPFGRNAVWQDYDNVYHLSEASAPFVDSTGNGYDIASVTDVTSGVVGKIDDAVRTNSASSSINTTSSGAAIDDITLSAWVKIEGLAGSGPNNVVSLGSIGAGAQLYYRNGPDTFSVQTSSSSELRSTFTLADSSNTWALIHGVSSLSKMAVYANGSLNVSNAGTAATGVQDGTVGVGSPNGTEVAANSVLQNTVFDEVRIARTVFTDSYIATEYANQNDPVTFYGTPVISATGSGGGGTVQNITPISAEQAESASAISIAQYLALNSVTAEQVESATAISITEAQASNTVTAEQKEEVSQFDVIAQQLLSPIIAEQKEQADAISIEQSGAQSVGVVVAEQVEQAQTLTLEQQQALVNVIAQQLEHAELVNPASVQAVTMLVAEQREEAAPIDVQQYTGQLVTLIVAEQAEQASAIFISQVGAADIINEEQREESQALGITQRQSLIQISAEQVEEAAILHIISAGDQTDLSGLTLIPITEAYSLTPINVETYSLEEI